ncbi:hypothetical protein GCM10029992_18230 [Glycomyces albus]
MGCEPILLGCKVFSATIIVVSALLAAMLLGHRFIPNRWYNLGSLIETFLPWFGLAIPVLVVLAAIRRKPLAIIVALLPALVWIKLYAGLLPDKAEGPGSSGCWPTTSTPTTSRSRPPPGP